MIDEHHSEHDTFTLYGSPKGKPKQKRKLETDYSRESAAASAIKWLLKGYTVRVVVGSSTVNRWD